jgi:hypothetical protein
MMQRRYIALCGSYRNDSQAIVLGEQLKTLLSGKKGLCAVHRVTQPPQFYGARRSIRDAAGSRTEGAPWWKIGTVLGANTITDRRYRGAEYFKY